MFSRDNLDGFISMPSWSVCIFFTYCPDMLQRLIFSSKNRGPGNLHQHNWAFITILRTTDCGPDPIPNCSRPSYVCNTIFRQHILQTRRRQIWALLLSACSTHAGDIAHVSGIDRMPDSSTGIINSDKYDRGATFMKVSGALFLVAFAAICFGVIKLWKSRKALVTVSYYIVRSMVVVLPLLFLRILYSVLNSTNLDTTGHTGHTTKYNIMNGSWVIYLILGLIPQATIITVYIGSGVFAWMKVRRGTGVWYELDRLKPGSSETTKFRGFLLGILI